MGWQVDDLPPAMRAQAVRALQGDETARIGRNIQPSTRPTPRRRDAVLGGNERIVAAMTERDWQQTVVDYATARGWRHYHTHDSRRSPAGFPDLILVRPPRLVAVELKAQDGKLTRAQVDWLGLLQACPQVETHVWRPSDWPDVEETLR